MTIIKSTTSLFTLLLFSIIIGLSTQAQPQTNRNNTRHVSNILQRLERSSSRFRNSLNVALVQGSVDQAQPQRGARNLQFDRVGQDRPEYPPLCKSICS